MKNFYLVKYQGKRIKGVNGATAPGANDTVTSYIDYSLKYGAASKKTAGTRKVYITIKNLVESFRSSAVMADIEEEFVLGYIDFLRSDVTDGNSDATVAKYVERLKVGFTGNIVTNMGFNLKNEYLKGWRLIQPKGRIKHLCEW